MGYIDYNDKDLAERIKDNETKYLKRSCLLENKRIWAITISDNEINTQMESHQVINVESQSQIGDDIAQERHLSNQ